MDERRHLDAHSDDGQLRLMQYQKVNLEDLLAESGRGFFNFSVPVIFYIFPLLPRKSSGRIEFSLYIRGCSI